MQSCQQLNQNINLFHLNKLIITVKIILIIIQVTIGNKKVELPVLKITSPGSCPNPSFFM